MTAERLAASAFVFHDSALALTGRIGLEYRRDIGLLPDTDPKFGATS